MNVYDFDETIYNGESWIEFLIYCMIKQPKTILYLMKDVLTLYKVKFVKNSDSNYQKSYATFLKHVKDIEKLVEEFKQKRGHKIKQWYKDVTSEDDIVISTSPEFFVQKLLEDFNLFKVCGTIIDPQTGDMTGTVCHDREKYKRFLEEFGHVEYSFYTDDKIADKQMLQNAKKAFLVRKNRITNIDF